METFYIRLYKYNATAQLLYNTAQVSRYKIELQGKYFVLEQRHLNKSAKWKIIEYSNDVDIDKVIDLMDNIISQIENYLNPKQSHAEYLRGKR